MHASKAHEAAWARLLASLNAEQCRTVNESGYFEVRSNRGYLWRIHTSGYVGNCQRLVGRYAQGYCAHLRIRTGNYPLADHFLAQALLIRTDEDAFTRIAR